MKKPTQLFSRFIFLLLFNLFFNSAISCECPLSTLGMEECNKYEIIFKGKVLSVKDCGNKFGEAIFEVEELFKGNATKKFKVLFECGQECSAKFTPGDEWIIYTRYKQMENALMDWCSRSRKFFKIDKLDFYTTTYGNDYDDELKFLRSELGNHRLLADNLTRVEERNKLPTSNETILIFISSLAAIVLFYYLFNKFFR
jgi:hypothetical protein